MKWLRNRTTGLVHDVPDGSKWVGHPNFESVAPPSAFSSSRTNPELKPDAKRSGTSKSKGSARTSKKR